MNVEELWSNIEKYYDPRKTERQKLFYDTFSEVIRNVHNGFEYTDKEAEKTRYWDYLKGYHESWQDPTPRAYKQLRAKFFSGINLYHDIKENGLKDPVNMRVVMGKKFLHTGNRRLVIAHILGIKTLEVNECDSR